MFSKETKKYKKTRFRFTKKTKNFQKKHKSVENCKFICYIVYKENKKLSMKQKNVLVF
nr:MAG TPA: hypothetical protein [Caudoviricetes sp.]